MMITWIALGVIAYAYVGYPLILWLVARTRRGPPAPEPPGTWPAITVTIPVFNGARAIAQALDAVLAADYPGPRQVLVVSDGSTDETEQLVHEYAVRGVELYAVPTRIGKTAAETLALTEVRGTIVVNTDASVRLHPGALRALVTALADPEVGVASSRDVSVGSAASTVEGEHGYVGYEMWLRALESRVYGIVGASGSLYAIRAELHRRVLPPHLTRDFAAPLTARLHGLRAVSVPEAICFVPRGRARQHEYRRKVRTMTRGLVTLWYHRALMDPRHYGLFAWMLASHKLVRWLTPPALVVAVLPVALGAGVHGWPRALLGAGVVIAGAGWWWPGAHAPAWLALPAYAAGTVVAGLHAWWYALAGPSMATWDPTDRGGATTPRGGPA